MYLEYPGIELPACPPFSWFNGTAAWDNCFGISHVGSYGAQNHDLIVSITRGSPWVHRTYGSYEANMANPTIYIGGFRSVEGAGPFGTTQGMPHGKGTLFRKDGARLDGFWENGIFQSAAQRETYLELYIGMLCQQEQAHKRRGLLGRSSLGQRAGGEGAN
tara:strand:+ start:457 stop:939 length:483 start_codon:yes stop_codon:yes gene_type:complete